MQKIYDLVNELNESISSCSKITFLNKIEALMENDKEVILLVREKEKCETKYNDLLKIYPKENEYIINARKQLYLAKEKLDDHPIVKQYLKAYQEVRKMYHELNKTIFDGIQIIGCNKR